MYVGHTTSFTHRKREHKSRCNNNFPFPIYKTINDNNGWENWEMIEIEKYACKDANEARARERYWYEILTATLNARSPTLNVEKRQEREKNYHKQYYQETKDEQNIKKKKKVDCECGGKYCHSDKARHFKTKRHLSFVGK